MNPKILVLSISSWNSSVGMNTWPTLLEGNSPDNIAHICLRGEFPDNKICNNYFHISENKVIKSILRRNIKTGEKVDTSKHSSKPSTDLLQHNERYRKMKNHRSFIFLAIREILWFLGKWKTKELENFISEFKPDIILYSMDGYIHFNRLCRYVKKFSGAKSIGFFVDDNFTYKQSTRLGDLIFRFFQRRSLFKLANDTNAFWAITDMTKKEADATFGINCTVLTKPLVNIPDPVKYEHNNTIKMLYTGNLLIGRDKSLKKLISALKEINNDSLRFTVDVYTKTELEEKELKSIECDFCKVHNAVPQSQVIELQKKSDILLFLEDIDGPDAKTARLSFSTKITDYFAASKCIVAIGNEDTAPIQYFKRNNAALTAVTEKEIYNILKSIVDNPRILEEYAQKARDLGIENHNKEKIINLFNDTIHKTITKNQTKVLQINATYGFGSTGVIVADIGATVEKAGYNAFYAYQTANGKIKNGYRVGNTIDHKAHALLCRVFGAQGYYSCRATKKLIKHIKRINPDIVHIHNLHSNFVNIDLLFKFLAKENIHTIITMHDCWFFTGKCFHYVDCGCNGFMHGCRNCKKKNAPPMSIFFDRAAQVLANKIKRITAIPHLTLVGCSDWICNEAKKSLLKHSKILRIYNGVDTNIFKPQDRDGLKKKLNIESKRVIMGMANKWLLPENKKAFESVYNSLDDETEIVLVGCTDNQKEELKDYTKIHKIGFIKDREELAQFYAISDVFVNLTHADTLPTVNMESICSGTPVVSYDCGGSPELVLDGCGIVVKENDIESLLTAIKVSCAIDRKKCADIGLSNFDKNKNYEKYLMLYNELAKHKEK